MYLLDKSVLDDMGNRIDDLEKNIADLMTQAGVEEGRPWKLRYEANGIV